MNQVDKLVVLELSTDFGPTTLAGKSLADIGCQVIKVENRTGDSLRDEIPETNKNGSYLFDLVSASKYSIGVDFDKDQSSHVIEFLCSKSDVIILDDNYLRILSKIGFTIKEIHSRYPGLTIGIATPFGVEGPLASWQGNEEIIQAITGIMSVTGHENTEPTRVSSSFVTHATSLFLVSSILSDIMQKKSSLKGKVLDVSMFDTSLSFLTTSLPVYFLDGKSPKGIGNRHTMVGPWNSFKCQDGWVVICSGSKSIWQRLCNAIDRNDLHSDPRFKNEDIRMQNINLLEKEIEKWTIDKTAKYIEKIMDENAVPCGPILSLEEVLQHEYFAEKGLLVEDNQKKISGTVFKIPNVKTDIQAKMSNLGQGTSHILLNYFKMPEHLYQELLDHQAIFEGGN